MGNMLVKDLMDHSPLVVALDTTLKAAIVKMAEAKSSCLVVVSECKPVGIITERDVSLLFAEVLSDRCDLNRTVSEVMTVQPLCVMEKSLFENALILSRTRKFRHLPVVNEEDALVGIITQTSLVDAYAALLDRQSELEHSVEELKMLSMEDPLLRIGNRRAMEVELIFTEADALRHHKSYAVALVDIDFFKKYNDRYGHQQGDEALKQVAHAISKTVRTSDRVFRYGGEEILILMPETDDKSAFNCSERVRKAIENLKILHEEGGPLSVLTVSIGVAAEMEGEWKQLVEKADKAMYKSKHSGRNKTTMA